MGLSELSEFADLNAQRIGTLTFWCPWGKNGNVKSLRILCAYRFCFWSSQISTRHVIHSTWLLFLRVHLWDTKGFGTHVETQSTPVHWGEGVFPLNTEVNAQIVSCHYSTEICRRLTDRCSYSGCCVSQWRDCEDWDKHQTDCHRVTIMSQCVTIPVIWFNLVDVGISCWQTY